MKLVTVTIEENGDSSVDLAGFQGRGCAAIQEGFARAVGTSTHEIKKPEFHRPVSTQTKLQNKA